MRPDQILDLPTRRSAFESIDHLPVLEHEERRDLADTEAIGELRALLGVDVHHAKALLLGDLHPRDEALHPPRRTRVACAHEDERRKPVRRKGSGW